METGSDLITIDTVSFERWLCQPILLFLICFHIQFPYEIKAVRFMTVHGCKS